MICQATRMTVTAALECCLGSDKLAQRVFSKITRVPEGCWLWTDKPDPRGYGRLSIHGTPFLAHRIVFSLYSGIPYAEVPEILDHRCRNMICVNPGHLREGTQKQNQENLTAASRGTNTSGYRGVGWDKHANKWRGYIKHNYRYIHVGQFVDLHVAAEAVRLKRLELFTYNETDNVSLGKETD